MRLAPALLVLAVGLPPPASQPAPPGEAAPPAPPANNPNKQRGVALGLFAEEPFWEARLISTEAGEGTRCIMLLMQLV